MAKKADNKTVSEITGEVADSTGTNFEYSQRKSRAEVKLMLGKRTEEDINKILSHFKKLESIGFEDAHITGCPDGTSCLHFMLRFSGEDLKYAERIIGEHISVAIADGVRGDVRLILNGPDRREISAFFDNFSFGPKETFRQREIMRGTDGSWIIRLPSLLYETTFVGVISFIVDAFRKKIPSLFRHKAQEDSETAARELISKTGLESILLLADENAVKDSGKENAKVTSDDQPLASETDSGKQTASAKKLSKKSKKPLKKSITRKETQSKAAQHPRKKAKIRKKS